MRASWPTCDANEAGSCWVYPAPPRPRAPARGIARAQHGGKNLRPANVALRSVHYLVCRAGVVDKRTFETFFLNYIDVFRRSGNAYLTPAIVHHGHAASWSRGRPTRPRCHHHAPCGAPASGALRKRRAQIVHAPHPRLHQPARGPRRHPRCSANSRPIRLTVGDRLRNALSNRTATNCAPSLKPFTQ